MGVLGEQGIVGLRAWGIISLGDWEVWGLDMQVFGYLGIVGVGDWGILGLWDGRIGRLKD